MSLVVVTGLAVSMQESKTADTDTEMNEIVNYMRMKVIVLLPPPTALVLFVTSIFFKTKTRP